MSFTDFCFDLDDDDDASKLLRLRCSLRTRLRAVLVIQNGSCYQSIAIELIRSLRRATMQRLKSIGTDRPATDWRHVDYRAAHLLPDGRP